ncbi:MAG: exodeoxyribonuclease V subunit alpha [Balneolaceae bacterium]
MKPPGIFYQLLQKEVISVVEFEFVRFLLQLDNSTNQEVLLAAAACVHAQLNGHVCLDIAQFSSGYLFNDPESNIQLTESLRDKWLRILGESAVVSNNGTLQPLVLEDDHLYLHRFWKYEQELAGWIREKSAKIEKPDKTAVNAIEKIIGERISGELNWQHVALCLSFLKNLVVISGGPGTGKTFTVLNIIVAHAHRHKEKKYRVALAAPTGKAARRLAESISSGKENLPKSLGAGLEISDSALTVHKLLGSDFQGVNFKFNEQNKLPYDLVVVDEASMLDITMWIRLVRAIHADTKLIVLGDKDQLASVEAGSILGDICRGENSFSQVLGKSVLDLTGMKVPEVKNLPAINDSVVFLTRSYRFQEKSGIGKLAVAINNSDAETAITLLEDPDYPDVKLLEPTSENMDMVIRNFASDHFQNYRKTREGERLAASNQKKILCALRRGPFGVEFINTKAEQNIKRELPDFNKQEWYAGRIVMAKRNDGILKIRNGEIGICLGRENRLVQFEGENKMSISAGRLKEYERAYALTIHKSQGSEFDEVAIVLPSTVNLILSKEILYTSVTRARRAALVIGNKNIIRHTIKNSVARSSRLGKLIWKK